LRHEGPANTRIGGHTIRKHVGKTEAELFERFALKKTLEVSSSFTYLQTAEAAISATVRANARAIAAWSRSAAVGAKPKWFNHDTGRVVGIGVQRGSTTVSQKRTSSASSGPTLSWKTSGPPPANSWTTCSPH